MTDPVASLARTLKGKTSPSPLDPTAASQLGVTAGVVASIDYTGGVAQITLSGGSTNVPAVLPGSAVNDPSMQVGATVQVVTVGTMAIVLCSRATGRSASGGPAASSRIPSGRMYQTSGQSVPSGTPTSVTGMTADWTQGGVFFNNNSLQVPIGGTFRVTAAAAFAGGLAAEAAVPSILVNNAVVREGGTTSSGGLVGAGIVSDAIKLNANDIVGLSMFQNSGGTVTSATGTTLTWTSVAWESW